MRKKLICALLGVSMLAAALTGCSGSGGDAGTKEGSSEGESVTIDVYDDQANYQGTQTGWWGEVVKEKFGLELNIISPNVAGGGETLYQTRSAAGELGDLIIVDAAQGKLEELVASGLVMDLTDYIDDTTYLKQYMDAHEYLNEGVEQDGIYGLATNVSTQSATEPSEGLEPTFGPYVRWDLYKELGYPEMNTLDDLLDVLEAMQNLNPETETGKKAYALSFFADWDGNMMNAVKQFICFYGYDERGFVMSKADGTDYESILDEDGMYYEVTEFLNEAYRRGLVDPESSTQTYDTLEQKYRDGEVLFTFWQWIGASYYNTTERMEEGKGFMLAPIKDMEIFSYGAKSLGGNVLVAVGSNAENPEKLVEFLDWLYSPEGNSYIGGNYCGPEGLTWEMVDGEPALTEFGVDAIINKNGEVPEEWGGGDYQDGMSQLNIKPISETDTNPDTGYPYLYQLWESYQDEYMNYTLHQDWKEFSGHDTTMEYLEANDYLVVAPGGTYTAPEEEAEITTIRGLCKENIVAASWQMVYAESEETFKSLWDDMVEKVYGLGYEDVLAVDMQNAKDETTVREEAKAASAEAE